MRDHRARETIRKVLAWCAAGYTRLLCCTQAGPQAGPGGTKRLMAVQADELNGYRYWRKERLFQQARAYGWQLVDGMVGDLETPWSRQGAGGVSLLSFHCQGSPGLDQPPAMKIHSSLRMSFDAG